MRYSVDKWVGCEGYSVKVEIEPRDLAWLSRERASELCPAFVTLCEQADANMISPTAGEVSSIQFALFMKVLLRRELDAIEAHSKLIPKEQNAS